MADLWTAGTLISLSSGLWKLICRAGIRLLSANARWAPSRRRAVSENSSRSGRLTWTVRRRNWDADLWGKPNLWPHRDGNWNKQKRRLIDTEVRTVFFLYFFTFWFLNGAKPILTTNERTNKFCFTARRHAQTHDSIYEEKKKTTITKFSIRHNFDFQKCCLCCVSLSLSNTYRYKPQCLAVGHAL